MKASSKLKPKRFATWLHEPFLERASNPDSDEGRYALGAFLTLRLADRFRAGEDPGHPLALAYQTKATRDYLVQLEPQTPEVGYLLEIVRLADEVQQGGTRALLWAPLLAYGYWLEKRLSLGEALDVVETALGMSDGTAPDQEIAGLLQHGRVLRLMGLFDLARRSYRAARRKAARIEDTHSVLLSRIGDAIIMKQLGNLKGSERALRQILIEAEGTGDKDAQARAHHDLGAVLVHQGRAEEAIPRLYRAFELYPRQEHKLRALSDLGEAFKRARRYGPARDAFMAVLKGKPPEDMQVCTMIALLELSALMNDRVSFYRWRRQAANLADGLPPERLADLYLQLGVGSATFGKPRTGERLVRKALKIAEEHSLSEYAIAAHSALERIARTASPCAARADGAWDGSPRRSPGLAAIEQKLQLLAAC